jgi:hypothetical protein
MEVFLINYYDYFIFHYKTVLFSIQLINNHLIINFNTYLIFLPNFKINFDYPLHYLTCFQFRFICFNVLIIFYSNSYFLNFIGYSSFKYFRYDVTYVWYLKQHYEACSVGPIRDYLIMIQQTNFNPCNMFIGFLIFLWQ